MRVISCLSILALIVSPSIALAQGVAAQQSEPTASLRPPERVEAGPEKNEGKPGKSISHTDSGGTIEEVREGAETKSITVKPAYNAPSYNMVPDARSGQPGNYGNQNRKSVWKVLRF